MKTNSLRQIISGILELNLLYRHLTNAFESGKTNPEELANIADDFVRNIVARRASGTSIVLEMFSEPVFRLFLKDMNIDQVNIA